MEKNKESELDLANKILEILKGSDYARCSNILCYVNSALMVYYVNNADVNNILNEQKTQTLSYYTLMKECNVQK